MEFWISFWGWLLVIVLLVFAALTVAITIGGFFDVKEMLSTLDKQHQPDETDEATTEDG